MPFNFSKMKQITVLNNNKGTIRDKGFFIKLEYIDNKWIFSYKFLIFSGRVDVTKLINKNRSQ